MHAVLMCKFKIKSFKNNYTSKKNLLIKAFSTFMKKSAKYFNPYNIYSFFVTISHYNI